MRIIKYSWVVFKTNLPLATFTKAHSSRAVSHIVTAVIYNILQKSCQMGALLHKKTAEPLPSTSIQN